MKRTAGLSIILMLVMTVPLTGFTQIKPDTTRTVPVKAYKLSYLIRDASLLRTCDSLTKAQTESIKAKNLLNSNLEGQNLSLRRENKILISKDSARAVSEVAANNIYVQEKEELKQEKKTLWKVIIAEGTALLLLLTLLIIL